MSSSNPSAMPTYLFPWRIRTRLSRGRSHARSTSGGAAPDARRRRSERDRFGEGAGSPRRSLRNVARCGGRRHSKRKSTRTRTPPDRRLSEGLARRMAGRTSRQERTLARDEVRSIARDPDGSDGTEPATWLAGTWHAANARTDSCTCRALSLSRARAEPPRPIRTGTEPALEGMARRRAPLGEQSSGPCRQGALKIVVRRGHCHKGPTSVGSVPSNHF
jgi:hypothetical protein